MAATGKDIKESKDTKEISREARERIAHLLPSEVGSASSAAGSASSANLGLGLSSTTIPPRKQICQPLIDFNSSLTFSICYVQPDPLPNELHMLQKLNTKGLNFVKIPIHHPIQQKAVRLYLKEPICKLLGVCGIDKNYIERLIAKYNKDQSDANCNRLLHVVQVAMDFCEENNIEFLTERVESVNVPDPS
jgi:hypothetical protein